MELQCWKMRTTSSAGKEAMVRGDTAIARAPGRMTRWMMEVAVERMGAKSLCAPRRVYYLSICNRTMPSWYCVSWQSVPRTHRHLGVYGDGNNGNQNQHRVSSRHTCLELDHSIEHVQQRVCHAYGSRLLPRKR